MATNYIKFISISSTTYKSLEPKDEAALYYLSDTHEIYKGSVSYTKGVEFIDVLPESGAQGRIYLNLTTMEGSVWTSGGWKTVIKVTESTVTRDSSNLITSGGVYTHTKDTFNSAKYNPVTFAIDFTTKEGSTISAPISGFVKAGSYSADTGAITLKVQGGEDIVLNIPKDNFVKSGVYNNETKEIVLTMQNGTEVKIPANDLIDVYTGAATNSATTSIVDNTVKVDVKISTTGDNALVVKNDGLYVEPGNVDLSGVIEKVETSKTDEIILAKEDGSIKTSGKKIGGATLSEIPDANTLATEAAVAQMLTWTVM